ncbi:MAG TPA: D-alanyl-lipoteichoic acid biosynthesis protein DltD [Bacteroidia bacterium]|jgi:D-alanine transfer protein
MKQVLLAYILPALLSVFAVYYSATSSSINAQLFPQTESLQPAGEFTFIESFSGNKIYEDQFLQDNDKYSNIFLLGSSELTGESPASPYNFISGNYNTKVKAVGHAGNQCFSIYSQLLANSDRLKDARIVIILSPMWFLSKEAAGTASPVFLEFNSENFLNRIVQNNPENDFERYENKRVSDMFSDFTSPSFALRQMHFEHESSKSILHCGLYAPLIMADRMLFSIKSRIRPDPFIRSSVKRTKPEAEDRNINWDSLLTLTKNESLKNMTNNTWGINDDYFSEHIKGNTSKIKIGPAKYNYEMQDLGMLIRLLKENEADASFIILPMNPYYYTNLQEADPLISEMTKTVTEADYNLLNLWVTATSQYEKGTLKDIMHLSDHGWHKVNRFIVETYKLEK